MTRKKGEQPEFPIEDPKLPVELDGEGGGDSLFDVDGALAGLLDAVIPGAFGQDLPPGGRYVEQFQEEHQWSEVEFLPEGFTFRDYIMASAISAWEYENANLGEDEAIVPIELLISIIEKESGGSVVVNAALDVGEAKREEGWFARGDKFSLAGGATQMIPSTARGYGLRVMYDRDEVSIIGREPVPKDGYGRYNNEGREMTLKGRGWFDGEFYYPIVDQRTSVYHQMRGTVRYLSRLYEKAQRVYSDERDMMLEVASRYNSGRSKDSYVGNDSDIQRDHYLEVVDKYLDRYEGNTPDYSSETSVLPTSVEVRYDDAKVEPISIGDIVTDEEMELSLFRFLDENNDLRLNIPLLEMNGGRLRLPAGKARKASSRFGRRAADGEKVWDVCTVSGTTLETHKVKDPGRTSELRRSREFSRSSEDEIDMWERDGMWELTLQDVIDLGIRPSELLQLNPHLDLSPILDLRLPHGHEVVLPRDKKEDFNTLLDRANGRISEVAVDSSKRGRVIESARMALISFVSTSIMKTGSEQPNPFTAIFESIEEVGMKNSKLGELYEELADLSAGKKRWIDIVKDSKILAPIFMNEALRFLSERSKDLTEVTYNDYVCSLAILELAQSDHVKNDILTGHAETFLLASGLVESAADVTQGISTKRADAMEGWTESWVESAVSLSEISDPAVSALESLGEASWRDAEREVREQRARLLQEESFTEGKDKVKAYIDTLPKWDDFSFNFEGATFGYEKTSELADVQVPLYKPNLLMIPFEHKPNGGSSTTVAYMVFDLLKWTTIEDTWNTGSAEEITEEQRREFAEANKEELQDIDKGSGTFRVIGLDGEIGGESELKMDKSVDIWNMETQIASSVWTFYLREIIGEKQDGSYKTSRTTATGWKIDYFADDEGTVISIANPDGLEAYVIEPGLGLGELDVYPIDIETFEEKPKEVMSLTKLKTLSQEWE